MKAARYYGPKDIRVEEIDKPVPTSKQVLIKVLELSYNYPIDLSERVRLLGKWSESMVPASLLIKLSAVGTEVGVTSLVVFHSKLTIRSMRH
jgi:NADPH:quinone reductase-like Zn-dependent oxidoreductase